MEGSTPQVTYTHLGKSGLKVSNICLGTMTFGKQVSVHNVSIETCTATFGSVKPAPLRNVYRETRNSVINGVVSSLTSQISMEIKPTCFWKLNILTVWKVLWFVLFFSAGETTPFLYWIFGSVYTLGLWISFSKNDILISRLHVKVPCTV